MARARDTEHPESSHPAATADAYIQAERDAHLLASLPAAVPAPAARGKLLAELIGPERFTLFAADVARVFGVGVDDARAALRMIQDASAWGPGAAPGIAAFTTPALAERNVLIARLASGVRIPHHGHQERELTLVLDGALREGDVKLYGAGDVLDAHAGDEHAVEVAGERECIAVFCPANR